MSTDWGYKRERLATIDEIAESIRANVTIEDALNEYAPGIQIKHRRCPCPIHNGKDFNFSFNETGFKCFVCGESGDVISLVKGICELPTRLDAMRKICDDFSLPVNFHATISAEVSVKVNKRREEAERKRKEREEWEARYQKALNEWIELDKIVTDTPWDSEENIAKVCRAREERARVGYQVDLILANEPR